MRNRTELNQKLCDILGTNNVYFQPPETLKLNYPCIIYKKQAPDTKYADDLNYFRTKRYQITVVDKNPDSDIADRIAASFENIREENSFTSNNFYHTVLILYF